MATTDGDEALVKYILSRWTDSASGLDDAKEERYDVYLSFPDAEKPNIVQIGKSDLWHHYVDNFSNPDLLNESDYSQYLKQSTLKNKYYLTVKFCLLYQTFVA